MEKVLVQFDKQQYADQLKGFTVGINELNDILEAYDSMGLTAVDYNGFTQLMHDPKAFVFGKMSSGKDLKVSGLEIDATKAFDLLKPPAGFDELNLLIEKFKQVKGHGAWQHYLVGKDIIEGKVCVSKRNSDKLKEQCSIYAENAEELVLLQFVNKVIEEAKGMLGKYKPCDINALLNDCIFVKHVGIMYGQPDEYVVSGSHLKMWAKRLTVMHISA